MILALRLKGPKYLSTSPRLAFVINSKILEGIVFGGPDSFKASLF